MCCLSVESDVSLVPSMDLDSKSIGRVSAIPNDGRGLKERDESIIHIKPRLPRLETTPIADLWLNHTYTSLIYMYQFLVTINYTVTVFCFLPRVCTFIISALVILRFLLSVCLSVCLSREFTESLLTPTQSCS